LLYTSPEGFVAGDLLRFRAVGSVQIQPVFGAWKGADGDPVDAPSLGGWPAPGVRQYAMLMRITDGQVRFESTGSVPDSRSIDGTMVHWRWYAAGADSGCLRVLTPPSDIEFMMNEPNIGDNSGHWAVTLRQWW
jgi:hypothetical protein